ncbi:MAG TPA: hypothetical protein VFU48_12095 [Nitrospira sp.]|nr:hypothetical protein [Nitrospira sp.]
MVVLLLAKRAHKIQRIGKSRAVLGWEKVASRRGQGGWVKRSAQLETETGLPIEEAKLNHRELKAHLAATLKLYWRK